MKKRVLSMILALSMVISLLTVLSPEMSVSAAGADGVTDPNLKAMIEQNYTKPQGFDEDTISPYGTALNEVFTMMEYPELLTYVTADVTNDKKNILSATFENYLDGSLKTDTMLGLNNTITDLGDLANILSYTQAVAFDPTGCGRKNHIALVGYNHDTAYIEMYFLIIAQVTGGPDGYCNENIIYWPYKEGESLEPMRIQLMNAWWMDTSNRYDATTKPTGIDTVDAKNFIQITAGDYDGDGKDSVVVWAGFGGSGGDTHDYGTTGGLTEVKLTADQSATSLLQNYDVKTNRLTDYQMASYRASGVGSSVDPSKRLGLALTTGDVNGDGIDDLVSLAYCNDWSDGEGARRDLWWPELTVGYGKKGVTNGVADLQKATTRIYKETGKNTYTYDTMVAPGVSVGDIDGDGYQEVVVAGFTSTTSDSDRVKIQNDGRFTFAYYNCERGALDLAGSLQQITNVSPICYGDSLRVGERVWQQFSVECIAFAGMHTKEYMFLNGYIYMLNDDGVPTRADNLSYFEKLQTSVPGQDDVNENFIYSTVVGNFTNDPYGVESIAMIVGYKQNKGDDYNFRKLTISARSTISAGAVNVTGFTMTGDGNGEGWLVQGRGDKIGTERLNCILIPIDYDDDSIVAKYVGKDFVYTDPNVVAVLQAAPYFAEFDPGNSSTTYGYSESYVVSQGHGEEYSYSVGVSTEVEAGVAKIAFDAGYCSEIINEYTRSRETTYTTTFEANGENQVILRRTLVYLYNYEIAKGYSSMGGNDWTGSTDQGSAMVVAVPQYPVMSSLSIDQYNAFATDYNANYGVSSVTAADKAAGKAVYNLDIIDSGDIAEYHLDNEGNPFAYANNHSEYANGMELSGSTWMELSHSGGTTQLEYTTTLTEEQSHTHSDGGYFNLTVMAGGGLGRFKVYGGVALSFEGLRSSTVSRAVITGTNTGGTVQNLNASESDYGFSWKLIGWKTEPEDQLFDDVLFVGYAVRGARAPVSPVTDLHAGYTANMEDNGGTVTLSWTSPELRYGRISPDEFDVYRMDGEPTKIGTVPHKGEGQAHQFVIDVSDYEEHEATYALISVTHQVDGENSDFSNEAYCLFAMSSQETYALFEKVRQELNEAAENLKNAVAEDNGEAIAAAMEELTKAYEAADQLLSGRIDLADENIARLEQSLQDAVTALQSSIESVQGELEQAVEDLTAAIEAGDKGNSQEIKDAVTELTKAYEAADQLLSGRIDLADENIARLEQSMQDAVTALKSSIESVQGELEQAVQDLTAAIEAGDQGNSQEIKDAVAELTKAYEAADALLSGRIDLADENITKLEKALQDSVQALQNSIDAVQAKLTQAIEDLSAAIEAGDQANGEEIRAAVADLTAAYQAADELLKASIQSMSKDTSDKLATLEDAMNAADEALQKAIDQLRQSLEDARKELQAAIDANGEDTRQRLEEMEKAYAEADAALRALLEQQNAENAGHVADLTSTNDSQQAELNTARTVGIVGLSVAGVSMLGNIALAALFFMKKKIAPPV